MYNSTLYMALVTVVEKCLARSGVLESIYSIGRFKADAVCVERNFGKGQTIVYDGCLDGAKENVSIYNNPVIAIGEFVDRVYNRMDVEREAYKELLLKMDEYTEESMELQEDDAINDNDD